MGKPFLFLAVMAATLVAVSGVALAAVLTGTNGPDKLVGGAGGDSVNGLEGEDFLAGDPTFFGPGGDDSLAGGPGRDQVYGRGGDDAVSGGPGNDEISGTLGADAVSGGDGDDLVDDGPHFDAAADEISGGAGDDAMDAFNDPARADFVACGSGDDTAYTDGTDVIADDCEEIVSGPHPDPWDLKFSDAR